MVEKRKPRRWRKKAGKEARDKNPMSKEWRECRDLLQQSDIPKALEKLNALAPLAGTPGQEKVLGMLARAEARQGRIQKALDLYKKQEAQVRSEPRKWMLPVVGQVAIFLKEGRCDEAYLVAANALERAEKNEADFRKRIRDLGKNLKSGEQVIVAKRPPRASVVATRLGHLFLHAGEIEAAREFFNRVAVVNPKGGTRARLGLAEIALRSGEHAEAEQWALEGLVKGKMQAKTLSGLPILIAARQAQGKRGTDASLVEKLKGARGKVRDRSWMMVVGELRRHGDPAWKKTADQWLRDYGSGNPLVAAEIRKLFMADAAYSGESAQERLRGEELLAVPGITFHEWMSGARRIWEAQGKEDKLVLGNLERQALQRFGQSSQAVVWHSFALVCLKHGKPELGRDYLLQALARARKGSSQWGRTLWALAKAESKLGHDEKAAGYFDLYFRENAMPQRLRLYALLEWTGAVFRAGKPERLAAAEPHLRQALGAIDDFEMLLDVGRQLLLFKVGSGGLASAYRKKGETLVRKALADAADPSQAVTILFKWARRQNDFGDFQGTTAFWESMDASRKAWLWTDKREFWDYLAFVMRAYGWTDRVRQSEAIAEEYANDPATSLEGMAVLAIALALIKAYSGDLPGAFDIFDRVLREQPNHELCSYAYYWYALRAYKGGDQPQVRELIQKLRQALGNPSLLGWKVNLVVATIWLEAGMDEGKAAPFLAVYDKSLADRIRTKTERNLGRL